MQKKTNIYIPSDFITSERYYQARLTSAIPYNDLKSTSLKEWFLSDENVKYITQQLFDVYNENNYKYDEENTLSYDYFLKATPIWMRKWGAENAVNYHTELPVVVNPFGRSSTIYRYFMIALSKINQDFFREKYYEVKKIDIWENPGLTGKPDWNPYKASANIGSKNEFSNDNKNIMLKDLVYSVENTRNVDVWKRQQIIRSNKNFRYGNALPVWQAAGSANRGYGLDRSNDGLHDGNPDRASLENQIHGYIMGDITGDPKKSIFDLTNLQWPEEKNTMAGAQYFDQANYQPDTTDYYYNQFPYDVV